MIVIMWGVGVGVGVVVRVAVRVAMPPTADGPHQLLNDIKCDEATEDGEAEHRRSVPMPVVIVPMPVVIVPRPVVIVPRPVVVRCLAMAVRVVVMTTMRVAKVVRESVQEHITQQAASSETKQ